MKKSTVNPLRKSALLDKKAGNKWASERHPMTKLEKQAPKKPMTHAARKGTKKSGKAG